MADKEPDKMEPEKNKMEPEKRKKKTAHLSPTEIEAVLFPFSLLGYFAQRKCVCVCLCVKNEHVLVFPYEN